MKTKFYTAIIIALLFAVADLNAQTNTFPSIGAAGIGTTSPNTSSLLEIKSTAKGFLMSRMTKAQRDAIAAPANGLLIYQTNNTPGFYYYDGTAWKAVTTKAGWSLTGNASTDSSINFIGTADSHPLVFRVNNKRSGRIDYASVIGSGSGNTSFGYQSLFANTTGSADVALGYNALFSNTTGYYNTATGHSSLFSNSTGAFNTANGYGALYGNTTGNDNTAIGEGALRLNTRGSDNSALGERALYSNTTGAGNTANGSIALYANTTGNFNTATGGGSLRNNKTGYGNTGNGYNSLYSNGSGYYNTANGYNSLNSNINGAINSAYGAFSLYSNTTGISNTANGYQALNLNTVGSYNTANGTAALSYNSTGNDNTAIGFRALLSNTNSGNTAVGSDALFYNTGSENTGVGRSSLKTNASGSNNTANGYEALLSNSTGNDNTAIGFRALYSNTDNYNTAVGFGALYNNISGFNNSSLGIEADVSASNLFNSTAIGANAMVNASNKIRLGDGGITVVESNAGSWTVSDGRFKNNIKENVKGLEFIKLLKPVTYNFDTKKFQEFLLQNYPDSIKSKRMAAMNKDAMAKSSTILQSGFVAQEVAEAVKKSGYNFNGVHAPENLTDNWSLSYEKLVVPLVKAVQELSAKNDDLQKQIDDLKAMIVSNQSTVTGQQLTTAISSASLQQNIPNPFNNSTTVAYNLPQKFTSAQIVITDKNGKTLKAINVSGSGKGSLNIDASALASGAYQYSLIVDGRLIATKQMVMEK